MPYKKLFLFYTFITLVIIDNEFGLIWTSPWPNETELLLNFANRRIRKFLYEIKTFFLHQLLQIFFSHTLYLLKKYPITSLNWFEQILDKMKRAIFIIR